MRGHGGPALSPRLACSAGGCVLLCLWGAVLGGWPSTAARGVWCQALSLPLLPVLSGVGGQGSATRESRVRLVWTWGSSTGPTACALAGRRCALWGWQKGVPWGGCRPPLQGASEFRRSPSPGCPSSGWAVRVRYPRAVGAGVRVWGPSTHCPLGLRALLGAACRGGAVGGRPGGGWPSPFVRGVWLQALSLPWQLVLWGGQPGFRESCVPGAVGVGVGTQHRSQSVRPCEPLLRAVGLAEGRPRGGAVGRCEGRLSSGAPPPPAAHSLGGLSGSATHLPGARVCGRGGRALSPWLACPVAAACRGGGGGRLRGGGWPSTVVRGVCCQALSLPWPPVFWGGQPGFRDPCVPGAVGVGVGTQHRPHSVRPCEPSLRAVGVAEGSPRRGCLSPL